MPKERYDDPLPEIERRARVQFSDAWRRAIRAILDPTWDDTKPLPREPDEGSKR